MHLSGSQEMYMHALWRRGVCTEDGELVLQAPVAIALFEEE